MNCYQVIRQDVNCGPCRTLYFETHREAERAFDRAVSDGAIFVEIYDMNLDCQLRIEYPKLVWK